MCRSQPQAAPEHSPSTSGSARELRCCLLHRGFGGCADSIMLRIGGVFRTDPGHSRFQLTRLPIEKVENSMCDHKRSNSWDRVFENQVDLDRAFEVLLTKRQLSERLALSQSFINQLMSDEALPHFRIGRAVRFRVREVVAWLQKRRQP